MRALNEATIEHSHEYSGEHASISWRAILAGVFAAFLSYLILGSLGLAVGGMGLKQLISSGEGALPLGSLVWMVVSVFISLFVGGYLAARVSGLIAPRVGGVQGFVIASLFFIFGLIQMGSLVGMAGRTVGNVMGAAGTVASDLSKNPKVQSVLRESLSGLKLKSPPEQVVQGIAIRLAQGDSQGARRYLAAQAGISTAESDRKISQIQARVQDALTSAGQAAGSVISTVGWVLFIALALGSVAAAGGGAAGAKKSLTDARAGERPVTRRESPAA